MRTMFYKMLPPKPMVNVWEVDNPPEWEATDTPRPYWWVPDEEAYPLIRNGLCTGHEAEAIELWDYPDAPAEDLTAGDWAKYRYRVLTPAVMPQT